MYKWAIQPSLMDYPPPLAAAAACLNPSPFHDHSSHSRFGLSGLLILTMDAGRRSSRAKYECLLFDLDDTLYPMSSGLNLACRNNIEEFMLQQLYIEENEVSRMCLELYREYGTTMAGLKAVGYEFDDDEFHAVAHGKLPYAEALKPDPLLRNLLLSMPQRKLIFTNSNREHAAEVVKRLGLEDCFEGVICFETLNPLPPPPPASAAAAADDDDIDRQVVVAGSSSSSSSTTSPILCKPSLQAMQAAIHIANIDPSKTLFLDDSARNIASAKAAGLHTVIVGRSTVVEGADHALSSIHNIKEALPEIWQAEEEEEEATVAATPGDQVIIQSNAAAAAAAVQATVFA
ncbi:phosphate metabolism protein 8 [Diospyros lotus]|uniref:phosphate metabolism protein 8 n=1 Tax=Diospyros lotus TaxID=55363 RepID=UPI002257C066|nr:phosphate metabolism protein 8 [Diospyros lotus]